MPEKLERCIKNVKNCGNCEYWEPIPFHHKGGVCMWRKTLNIAPSNAIVSAKKQDKPVLTLVHS